MILSASSAFALEGDPTTIKPPDCEWKAEQSCYEDENIFIETLHPVRTPCNGTPTQEYVFFDILNAYARKTDKPCKAVKEEESSAGGCLSESEREDWLYLGSHRALDDAPRTNSGGLDLKWLKERDKKVEAYAARDKRCKLDADELQEYKDLMYSNDLKDAPRITRTDADGRTWTVIDPEWLAARDARLEELRKREQSSPGFACTPPGVGGFGNPDWYKPHCPGYEPDRHHVVGVANRDPIALENALNGDDEKLRKIAATNIINQAVMSHPGDDNYWQRNYELFAHMSPEGRAAVLAALKARPDYVQGYEPWALKVGLTGNGTTDSSVWVEDRRRAVLSATFTPGVGSACVDGKGDIYLNGCGSGQAPIGNINDPKLDLAKLPRPKPRPEENGPINGPTAPGVSASVKAPASVAAPAAAAGAPANLKPVQLPVSVVAQADNCITSHPETCKAKEQLDAARAAWYALHAPGANLGPRDLAFRAAVAAGFVQDTSEGMAAWILAGAGGLGDAAKQTYQYFLTSSGR